MRKIPRKKIYATPEAFERAVGKYFKGITRTVEVTEMVPSGQWDKQGHMIMKPQTVLNDAGKPVMRVEYVIAPSLEGLCTHLGICRDTWAEYARREGYEDIAAMAKVRCEAWLSEQLVSRLKGVDGIKFALSHGYGWAEKSEVKVNGGIEEYLASLPERRDVF